MKGRAILAIGCDLTRRENRVVVGRETAIACEKAAELYWLAPSADIVVVTAGDAGREWQHVIMAGVMERHLFWAHDVETVALCADTFNTDGEIRKFIEYLWAHSEITQVLVTVKWWHAPRVWLLLTYRLWEASVDDVDFQIIRCRSEAGKLAWLKEWFGAIPLTLLRISFSLWRKLRGDFYFMYFAYLPSFLVKASSELC